MRNLPVGKIEREETFFEFIWIDIIGCIQGSAFPHLEHADVDVAKDPRFLRLEQLLQVFNSRLRRYGHNGLAKTILHMIDNEAPDGRHDGVECGAALFMLFV